MDRLRILLLAPGCDPESLTTPLLAYEQANALARRHDVTLLVRAPNVGSVRRAGGSFHAVEGIALPRLDRLYAWAIRRIFKYDYGRQSLTAATYPYQVAFECRAWRLFRRRIFAGEFDVVLRVLPVVAVLPSPFAFFLRNGPIPFVLGPLNGGLPWPKGFPQLEKQRQEAGYWVARLRSLYRYLPFARSTYRNASAIIAGASHTYSEFAAYEDKLFFVPGENGVSSSFVERSARSERRQNDPLELIFVGRLIPLKACDLALRAAAPLLHDKAARLTVVGDGPERLNLERLAESLGVDHAVSFCGFLPSSDTIERIRQADVMIFPSLREFGGAVVFEALALGTVPVVADFGGPGDIVNSRVGYKVPLINEEQTIRLLQSVLKRLASDRGHLGELSTQAIAYARDYLTWDSKARLVTDVLLWVTRRGPRPNLAPPRRSTSAAR